MSKKVIVKFHVVGELDDIEVYANNERLTVRNGKGSINDSYYSGWLTLWFCLSGDNGTGFTIEYSCTIDGQPATDSNNPSIIDKEIVRNGYKDEKVFIKI